MALDGLSGKMTRLTYTLDRFAEGKDINEALAQRNATTEVKLGMNGGRLLRHNDVVKAFKRYTCNKLPGRAKWKLPEDVPVGELDAIIYMQDQASLAILGAERITLKGDR
jgi:hypothetical protein